MNHTPMAQKPHPHKETFNNKAQIYRLNITDKFKPTINTGSPVRKHLVTKFKFIDSMYLILTNSNPQSIVVLLCLYKKWHHPPGYKLFVSLLSRIHHICIPSFPFDPPTQSGTFSYCNLLYIAILFSHIIGYYQSTVYNYDLIRCMLTLPDQSNIASYTPVLNYKLYSINGKENRCIFM